MSRYHPLAKAFTLEARMLGERLFRDRMSMVQVEKETRLDVQVRPQGDNLVSLLRKDAETPFEVICSCFRFRNDSGLCGHVWAAILESEECGWFHSGSFPSLERDWRRLLSLLGDDTAHRARGSGLLKPPAVEFRIVYHYCWDGRPGQRDPVLKLLYEKRLKTGQFGKTRPFRTDEHLPIDPEDRALIGLLRGASPPLLHGYSPGHHSDLSGREAFVLGPELLKALLPRLCDTGRLFVQSTDGKFGPYRWREAACDLHVRLFNDAAEEQLVLDGFLLCEQQEEAVRSTALVLEDGFVFFKNGIVGPLDHHGAFPWLAWFKNRGAIRAPIKEAASVVEEMLTSPALPPLTLGQIEGVEIAPQVAPKPKLLIRSPRGSYGVRRLDCEVRFCYGSEEYPLGLWGSGRRAQDGRFVLRDRHAEARLLDALRLAGCQVEDDPAGAKIRLAPVRMEECVGRLLEAGWWVEADGRPQRQASNFSLSVKSGIDWFDVKGSVSFGDTRIELQDLLQNLKAGTKTVRLGDGSVGILPEDWLRRFNLLGSLGRGMKNSLRLKRSQGFLLDVLLAEKVQVQADERFHEFREKLRGFQGIAPCSEGSGFSGELRGYQRIGLAWCRFLHDFGLGGCLADDMGLGKTVQFLAHLQKLLEEGRLDGPALVVAPLSVVSNWVSEARRFTPGLRVVEYTGSDRARLNHELDGSHLVVTTYGLLRADILFFKKQRFSYAVLDEAQAIKNPRSQTAKAAYLLEADHRLALSGTPIENHLGELWSLFEFLNPGMLGRSRTFRALAGRGTEALDLATRGSLARALAPFILRRAKGEVAKELPEREEQTLYCDFGEAQRELYEGLRQHYRRSLLKPGQDDSVDPNKMHVLEALLRLRQAACHPGLLDVTRVDEESAKLRVLLPRLAEIVDEGHKALVFSQFTSLLDIVERRLNEEQIVFERLDGSTRNRPARVERFQTDPACQVFLISLKAGGLGLNLTAAGYVFILDPWWNPAVEAQAIDRAHRIGQTRRVMAYRLIGRDSVEEKILELQSSKRDLADALICGDGSLLQKMTEEDLALLLS
ncbi:MAG: SNF2-related protein [Planctomycetota bacterium]